MMALMFAGFALQGKATGGRADDWPQWLGPQRDAIWRETGILQHFPEQGLPIVWRTPIAAGYAGPAVAKGRVYVMDRQAHDEPKKKPADESAPVLIEGNERILCLDAANGEILWIQEYDCPYGITYPIGPRTTPVVSDGKVYALGAEGKLLCLRTDDGEVLWSHDFNRCNVSAQMRQVRS